MFAIIKENNACGNKQNKIVVDEFITVKERTRVYSSLGVSLY
jgi:hypothetical protein